MDRMLELLLQAQTAIDQERISLANLLVAKAFEAYHDLPLHERQLLNETFSEKFSATVSQQPTLQ
ncbi:hypothetical protein IVA80_15395 [Bradyrhizobium sp. 139]|uniref:hypothetical protein n=1 Tax=Bradyrhizobium sp. 139 TaxID=2782616 RepID=UPI001FF81140|nr:hypothetical protein [Bradyrhizobium sp. 139]MCK1742209.1 hypothetical protein [Bradyrhizobium sp. 139]